MECTKNNSEYEKIDEDIILKKDLNKRAYIYIRRKIVCITCCILKYKIRHKVPKWYC